MIYKFLTRTAFRCHLLTSLECRLIFRTMSTQEACVSKGLFLSLWENKDKTGYELGDVAKKYDAEWNQSLSKQIESINKNISANSSPLKKGTSYNFFGLVPDYFCVNVANLGKRDQGINELEQVDELKESIRTVSAAACQSLRDNGARLVDVDTCGDSEATAEGCTLGLYHFDELKSTKKPEVQVSVNKFEKSDGRWDRGLIKAKSQNISRRLMELPANHMTPTIFGENVQKIFSDKKNVQVYLRDKKWIEEKKMGSYLSVSRGSVEPPVFVEVHYNGGPKDQKPIALVGKGITFDSGGISLKPSANMDDMRADMGGAACVMGTMNAVAELQLPVNVVALTPMTENMPGACATKPGDVVTAMNGKTIQIDNTDAEGRLVLADALCYAEEFQPRVILDMATLTGAIMVALGRSTSAVFTNSTKMYEIIRDSSIQTGDRVWRMPLFDCFTKHMTDCLLADLNNIGTQGRLGGSCTAAAFLREFVTNDNWLHLDIAGVMMNKDDVPYLCKGMSGRPVRTIVEFVQKLAK